MMRWVKTAVLCLILIGPFTACQSKRNTIHVTRPEKTGITTIRFYDESRKRPLLTEVWYPIDANAPAEAVGGLWVRCPEARDAPLKPSNKKHPLIMMSHGNGGDRMNNAWLAEILAANGYIVASTDHHGNTWNNHIAECFVKIWERPVDVSAVIDNLLKDERFGAAIDHKKIGFIGYSLGGQTGIWLAGGKVPRFEKPDIETLPADQIPDTVNDELIDSIDFSPARASYRDSRVSAFFIMAPALGYLFDTASLQAISVPVYIIVSEGDKLVPLESSGKILASAIKKAAINLIPGAASHYVFLNEVSKGGKMMLNKNVALDHPSVDRAKIHEDIAETAVAFFDKNLK
jgi:predicted dienelactone hydrolase